MNYYLDSSALVRWLFKSPGYFSSFKQWKTSLSSNLLAVECYRTIDRLRMENQINDDETVLIRKQLNVVLQSITIIEVNNAIMQKAQGAFPTIIKTLDAIHLSTALLWQDETGKDLTLVSHDQQLISACEAAGMKVYR